MKCPVCGSQDYKFRYVFPWGKLLQCLLCTCAFGDGYNVEEMNRLAFGNSYIDENIDLCRIWAKGRLSMLKRHITSGSLLEFGSSTGEFLYTAAQAGFYAVGVDLFPRLREENIHSRVSIIKADARYFYAEEPFDVVAAIHMLEHFSEPYEFLSNVRKNLKENGYFMVEVPNYSALDRRIMRRRWRGYLPYHFLYMTPKALSILLGNAGFKIIEIQTVGSSSTNIARIFILYIFRHLGMRFIPEFKPIGMLDKYISNFERLFFWGLNLRAIAQKV